MIEHKIIYTEIVDSLTLNRACSSTVLFSLFFDLYIYEIFTIFVN